MEDMPKNQEEVDRGLRQSKAIDLKFGAQSSRAETNTSETTSH